MHAYVNYGLIKVLLIALAFENCVDLAHAPLAFLYSDFVWGLCGSKVTRKTQPFKRKCNQQYYS